MSLLYVAPAAFISDASDISALYTKVIRNGLMCFSVRCAVSNHSDESIGQGCQRMFLAFFSSVRASIKAIVSLCSPIEVYETIIQWIAVFVARLIAIWTRPDKSLKNDVMNKSLVPSAEGYHMSSIFRIGDNQS